MDRIPKEPKAHERRYAKKILRINLEVHSIILKALEPLWDIWPNLHTDADDDIGSLRRVLTDYFDRDMPKPVELTVGSIRHQLNWVRRWIGRELINFDTIGRYITSSAHGIDDLATGELGRLLGIDIRRDTPEIASLVDGWIGENLRLIKALSVEQIDLFKPPLIDDLAEKISAAWQHGMSLSEIHELVKTRLEISDRRAEFIARDQILKLHGQITKQRQTQVGIAEYIWNTSRDERVRPSHKALHGTRQRWDTPPMVAPGRHEHPGGDFRCRCVAIPVKPTWME